MAQADFAQHQSAHGHRQCLRAGIAGLACNHRQQHRPCVELGDSAFKEPYHRGCKKSGKQVDLQPWQAFSHGESRFGKCTLVLAGADHGLNVEAGFFLYCGHERGLTADTDQAAGKIHHRQIGNIAALQQFHHFLARRDIGYHRRDLAPQLLQRHLGLRHCQVLDLHAPFELPGIVHQKNFVYVASLERPQPRQCFVNAELGAQRYDARVHQLPCRIRRIIHQLAEFGDDLRVEQCQAMLALLRFQPDQQSRGERRLQLRQQMAHHVVWQEFDHRLLNVGSEFVPYRNHGVRWLRRQQCGHFGGAHQFQAARCLSGVIEQIAEVECRDNGAGASVHGILHSTGAV